MNLDELAQYLRDSGITEAKVTDVGAGHHAITVLLPTGVAVVAATGAPPQFAADADFTSGITVLYYGGHAPTECPDGVLYTCHGFTEHGEAEADRAIEAIRPLLQVA